MMPIMDLENFFNVSVKEKKLFNLKLQDFFLLYSFYLLISLFNM